MAIITVEDTVGGTSELGYVNGYGMSDYQRWVQNETVPRLQWPQSVQTFDHMYSEDSRMASVVAAIMLPIRRTKWRIDPNGADQEVIDFVCENLGLPMVGASEEDEKLVPRRKGRFNWNEHLRLALKCIIFGHAFFEQLYDAERIPGKLCLKKLAPRPQNTIRAINVDKDGGLESIEQMAPAGNWKKTYVPTTVEIPVSRLVAYAWDMDPGIWTGRSLLRPSFKHWLLKNEFIRIEATIARRNGMGVPVAKGGPDDDPETITDKMRDLATEFTGGSKSGIGLAFGQEFDLKGVSGNLPDIRAAIEYHDKQMALAGLAHFLNLDRGGSYAMASVQSDTFVQSVQSFADYVADMANEHIVEDLVDLNFGSDARAPRIVCDEIGSRQDLTAQALKLLIDAGLIRLDRTLEESVRQQYGLPPKDTPPPEEEWTIEDGLAPNAPPAPVPTDDPAPPEENPPGSESVVNKASPSRVTREQFAEMGRRLQANLEVSRGR